VFDQFFDQFFGQFMQMNDVRPAAAGQCWDYYWGEWAQANIQQQPGNWRWGSGSIPVSHFSLSLFFCLPSCLCPPSVDAIHRLFLIFSMLWANLLVFAHGRFSSPLFPSVTEYAF
jgi:hypothetical protein